jgi:hypothetical protein
MEMNLDDYEFDSDSEEDEDDAGGRDRDKKEVNDLSNMLARAGGDGDMAWTTEHVLLVR